MQWLIVVYYPKTINKSINGFNLILVLRYLTFLDCRYVARYYVNDKNLKLKI
jgi:hypothetical protein